MSHQFPLDGDETEGPTHPRFRERLAEVAEQSVQSRKRKFMVAGALVVLLALAAGSTQTPLFDVDEVRIVGAQQLDPDELRETAGIELGTPLLGLDTDAAQERLDELPAIAETGVEKSWGGRVTVEIRERRPVARIETLDGVIVVAEDGIVIDLIAAAPVPEGEIPTVPEVPDTVAELLEISGAMFSSRPGRRVPAVLTDAVTLANALPSDITEITERVEITVDSLVLRVVGGGAISIGDARDLDDKFEAIRAFLSQVNLRCLNTLNVRAPSVPVVVRNENC